MMDKIAYLRGLMDGMKLADDDNGKLMRAIADCLEAIANEVEVESARTDVIEEQLDDIDEELDEIDEIFDALLEDDDEEEDEDEDYEFEPPMPPFPPMHHHGHGCCHGHHGMGHGPHGPHGHGCCHHHHDEDEDFDAEAFLDSFNYFTCPNCGEIVPIDDEMLEAEADPICPNCNAHIFGGDAEDKPEGGEGGEGDLAF